MSDTDSFVEEVTEELRRDRLFALWKRWGLVVVGGIVAVVGVAAVLTWLDHQRVVAAQEAGGELISAGEATDPIERAGAYSVIADGYEGGPAVIARLSEAGASVEAGETETALAALDAVADDPNADRLYKSLAAFKAALLRSENASASERVQAMEPFAFQGEPFRLLALEMRAAAYLEIGDKDAARREIESALAAEDVTPTLRERLDALLSLAGGEPGADAQ